VARTVHRCAMEQQQTLQDGSPEDRPGGAVPHDPLFNLIIRRMLCSQSTSAWSMTADMCRCAVQDPTTVSDKAKAADPQAETVEKYGLEAGLWKVFTSKGEAAEGGQGKGAQAKQLLAKYGSAYLITSISFAIVSFAACYALVNAGAQQYGACECCYCAVPWGVMLNRPASRCCARIAACLHG